MNPEQLDEYLAAFGKNVSMRSKGGGKMISVDKLREYIKSAVEIAIKRSGGNA
jgi:hypothetical protein